MEWYLLILTAAGTVAAVAALTLLIKAQREFVKLVLREKAEFLATAIPLLEALSPYVPPQLKEKYATLLEVLKISKTVNEALVEAPLWALQAKYVSLKAAARG